MNILFVVNPVAGKGNAESITPEIENYCKANSISYTIEKTLYKGHATELAKEAISSGYTAVIAVGGDGTLLETANGLIGSSLSLGILPAGTGNDFARSIGVPQTIPDALEFLIKTKARLMDVGQIGSLFFMNVASIGFDAEIIRDIAKIKRFVPGRASYYLSVFLKFFSYRCKKITLELDGQQRDENIFLLAVANGCYYGGGMKVNPEGMLEDGYLDVIVIRPIPRYKIPILFWKFAKGTYQSLPYVTTYRCKKIVVQSLDSLGINADGDILAHTPMDFSVQPLALNIMGS